MNYVVAHKDLFEALSYIATIVGAFSVPFAVFLFFREMSIHRAEREISTYNDLAGEYRDFLKLCLESGFDPYGNQSDTSIESGGLSTDRLIIYEMLVSIFETAFFQYRMHSNVFKDAQWSGWNTYIRDWCRRPEFRYAWKERLGGQFDTDFVKHMNGIMRDVESGSLHRERQG
jgi:hypothetical protein